MGKDAHPFVGKIWVSLREACGTPLGLVRGDQSACSCQLLQWVESAEKSALGREAGLCGDSIVLKAQTEAHYAGKWVHVQIRQRDT